MTPPDETTSFDGSYRGFEVSTPAAGVLLVTLAEPAKLNGITTTMKRDLRELLTQIQMDHEVRVLVVTGSGRAFSAGDDITGRERSYPDDTLGLTPTIHQGHDNPLCTFAALRTVSQELNLAVRRLDKITIAAVNGIAIQSGLSLALSCDFRVAAQNARLGAATLRFGLLPDEGSHVMLVRLLGVARALDLLLRNRIVTASEALELGLVHEVTSTEDLLPRAIELATEFASGPQVALRLLKRSVYNAAEMTFEQALEDIATKTAISDFHPDARAGVQAFREKRTPRFE